MVTHVNARADALAPQSEHEAELLERHDLSYAERAYRVVRDRLVMLAIKPGAPVHDAGLAAELGVGRTPVREALKRLEAERLVVAYPRRGTFATEVNITDLAQISEVRTTLEPLAARAAARRGQVADHELLRDVQERLERLAAAPGGDPTDLLRLDMRVHRALYAATHNPYLADTLTGYHNLAMRIWCLFSGHLDDMASHVTEHAPLLDAVIEGDAEQAAELAAEHIRDFEDAVRAAM